MRKANKILDVSADLMGNRIRRQEKVWVAPKEDRNKKPGRVGGTGGALQLADQADDEGHLGGGIDQSAGSLAPALDNSCPAENPSQLRKICRQTAGTRQSIRQKQRQKGLRFHPMYTMSLLMDCTPILERRRDDDKNQIHSSFGGHMMYWKLPANMPCCMLANST